MTPTLYRHSTSGWTTADELVFLDGLGTWRDPGSTDKVNHRKSRHALLLDYQAAMTHRARWGNLNEAEVRAKVERLIEEEAR